MRNILLSLFLTLLTLLFVRCSDFITSEIDSTDSITKHTISITAAMPSDEPTTRIALTQEQKNITLSWEEGDLLELVFVQEKIMVKQIVAVQNISDEGKKAQFDIVLPNEFRNESFNLFGIYGGGGLDPENPTLVILPENSGDAGSLAQVQDRKDIVLYFTSKGIDYEDPNIVVTFQHLGSLFSIALRNTGSTVLNNITEARLVGQTAGSSEWAYNNASGGGKFNLINETFIPDEGTAGNYISFKSTKSIIAIGEKTEFWAWYPPHTDKIWPELKLELISGGIGNDLLSTNSKPQRQEPTAKGKAYYFYADYDGAELSFTSEPEPGGSEGELLFPGSDFEDWEAFIENNLPTPIGNKPMLSQSPIGKGVDGGYALSIKGPVISGTNPILLRCTPPANLSLEGKSKIVFYIKGESIGRSPVFNWFKPNGSNYYAFGLINTNTEDRVIVPSPSGIGADENSNGANPYSGSINTGGNWVKIELMIADLQHGIGNSGASGYLFAIRFPSAPTEFDLLIDNITIE